MSLIEISVVLAAAMVAVLMAMLFLMYARRDFTQVSADNGPQVSLLFNGGDLVHATPGSLPLVEPEGDDTDWTVLRENVMARFPAFPSEPPTGTATNLEYRAADPEDKAVLRIQTFGGHARVEVVEATPEEINQATHELRMLKARHDRLVRVCDTSPYPMWNTDTEGEVTWHNKAYAALLDRLANNVGDRGSRKPILDVQPNEDGPRRARASVALKDLPTPSWYDVMVTPQSDGTINHATNIDAVIRAEIAQRNFVQTLAKTFAQLSIGLAIFDRNGQLALFNPALVDLSGLPAVFLSTRPDLLTFFDRLRDNRMMPEPKNYSSWRQEIADVIKAASDGTYQETWSLDNGQTYRVSGRPHPDGAVAFLIEDISAEVSLTRNFRAELELGQSMLDTFEDCIVVFSSSGIVTFSNRAYREFWKVDPDKSFADVTIHDCVKLWALNCKPDPAWADIRDFVMKIGERVAWDTWLEHKDGSRVFLTISPIASNATVLRFDVGQSNRRLAALKSEAAE